MSQRTVEIQLMAGLGKYRPAHGTLLIDGNDTIMDVIKKLGMETEMVQMAFVDGKFINFTTPLKTAERILLLPAVGGG